MGAVIKHLFANFYVLLVFDKSLAMDFLIGAIKSEVFPFPSRTP
jgi:hypothetical protein